MKRLETPTLRSRYTCLCALLYILVSRRFMVGFPAERDSDNHSKDGRDTREKPSRRARYICQSIELGVRQNYNHRHISRRSVRPSAFSEIPYWQSFENRREIKEVRPARRATQARLEETG